MTARNVATPCSASMTKPLVSQRSNLDVDWLYRGELRIFRPGLADLKACGFEMCWFPDRQQRDIACFAN